MSERQKLVARRESLGEIREILDAMKGFAYMETRKLAHVLTAQQNLVTHLEGVAMDFLHFFAGESDSEVPREIIYLVLGTERGFCGDINRRLYNAVQSTLSAEQPSSPQLLLVGHKLHGLFSGQQQVAARLDGASALEDIDAVLVRLVDTLVGIQRHHPWIYLRVIYLGHDKEPVSKQLLPPFEFLQRSSATPAYPPLLQLAPGEFYLQLTRQYLYAALNEILTLALMSENHSRVAHLDQAVAHLEDKEDELRRRSNSLRQEEITEELEVILLSADSLGRS